MFKIISKTKYQNFMVIEEHLDDAIRWRDQYKKDLDQTEKDFERSREENTKLERQLNPPKPMLVNKYIFSMVSQKEQVVVKGNTHEMPTEYNGFNYIVNKNYETVAMISASDVSSLVVEKE